MGDGPSLSRRWSGRSGACCGVRKQQGHHFGAWQTVCAKCRGAISFDGTPARPADRRSLLVFREFCWSEILEHQGKNRCLDPKPRCKAEECFSEERQHLVRRNLIGKAAE